MNVCVGQKLSDMETDDEHDTDNDECVICREIRHEVPLTECVVMGEPMHVTCVYARRKGEPYCYECFECQEFSDMEPVDEVETDDESGDGDALPQVQRYHDLA